MMQTFFFYDLETTGFDPKVQRILQFAGQRTSLELEPIGEPVNFLIRLSPDVLPDPWAIGVSGITPQQTLEHGLSERDAVAKIMLECFTPDTIAVGFNNIRFDDEFIRYAAYRNFWDAYVWHWQDGRGRWDLLDAARLIRALRPEGVTWPNDSDGRPVNSLAALAEANHIEHYPVHDASGDVRALIGLTRLLKSAQPKMVTYLLGMRAKSAITQLVNLEQPAVFVYASGSWGNDSQYVTAALPIGAGTNDNIVVYDLRRDPTPFLNLSVKELRDLKFATREQRAQPGFLSLPAKELAPGRCPAVAPWSTVRPDDAERLGLDADAIKRNLSILGERDLRDRLTAVFQPPARKPGLVDVDAALYDGFINHQGDRTAMRQVQTATDAELAHLRPAFHDPRLDELWLRYRGRNTPEALSPAEQSRWQQFVAERRSAGLPGFKRGLAIAKNAGQLTPDQVSALTEWSTQPAGLA